MTRSAAQLHHAACLRGALTYTDPQTGYQVFTALALERRGDCCGCGCRHCPYGHSEVDSVKRNALESDPWIEGVLSDTTADLLFWSGGKDSYLALRALEREAAGPVVLLTTFDGRSGRVAHQEVDLDAIRQQRKALGCLHVLVPLFPGMDYMDRIVMGIKTLQLRVNVSRLVFGDLHLDHVRSWREDAIARCDEIQELPIHLPLWGVAYSDLLDDLEVAPGEARVSAVADESCASVIAVGDVFGRELIARLPADVDAFGENGEFHSYVHIPPRFSD